LIIPQSEEYQELAEDIAVEFADYVYSLRNEFIFHQLTLDPEEALDRAIREDKKPIFITDSGDNTTGGAPGITTLLLQMLMKKDIKDKKIAVAAILDKGAHDKLLKQEIGKKVTVEVGVNYNEDSAPVKLEGILKAKGDLLGYYSAKEDIAGSVCTVSVGNIDVVVADHGDSFTTINHFTKAGLDINDYDIIIVKQGYLFVDLNAIADLHIMAMTPGACNLIVEEMEFNNLIRPMYPLDK